MPCTARVVDMPPFLRRLADLLDLPLCDGAPDVAEQHSGQPRQG
jgi:hypothetical protein